MTGPCTAAAVHAVDDADLARASGRRTRRELFGPGSRELLTP